VPSGDLSADLAQRYIAATLGVQVDPWDCDGRQGVYDLRYYDRTGRLVAVEAKSVLDEALQVMTARIGRTRYVEVPSLQRRWRVNLDHAADVRLAKNAMPALLEQLEQRGWHDRLAWRRARFDKQLREEIGRLSVSGLLSLEPTQMFPPGFHLRPEGWGAWAGSIPSFSTFVSERLADEDSKLVQDLHRQLGAAAEADERHAFLVIGAEFIEGWPLMASVGDALPSDPPILPADIDGVWLASFSSKTRVVAWLPDRGWIEGRREVPR
jgi:hypothetical protein